MAGQSRLNTIAAVYTVLNGTDEASAELKKSILLLSKAKELQAKQLLVRALLLQARQRNSTSRWTKTGGAPRSGGAISEAREWKHPKSAEAARSAA